MRLLDLLGDNEDETPEPAPIPATFLAAPTPADTEDADTPLLPGRARTPEPRQPPSFAPSLPQPPRHAAPVKRRPRRKLGFRHATESARDLAEACAEAWHGHHGGGRMEIPVGVVAALALLPFRGDALLSLEDWIHGLDDQQLWKLYEEIWAYRWIEAPHLVGRCGVISSWLEDDKPDRNLRAAVRAVTERAIQYGVLELANGHAGLDVEVDLMSWMVTTLRSKGARDGLGEFHTPPEVCELLARTTLGGFDDIPSDMSFLEPASGTGGMVRASVKVLRDMGHDPAKMRWVMVDVDGIAVAGAAVNAILWGIAEGTAVIKGDSLAEGDIDQRALREAAEMTEHRDQLYGAASMVAALRAAERLLATAPAA